MVSGSGSKNLANRKSLLIPGAEWPWPDPRVEFRATADEHDLQHDPNNLSAS
jgi:hypothetical protein